MSKISCFDISRERERERAHLWHGNNMSKMSCFDMPRERERERDRAHLCRGNNDMSKMSCCL